MTLTGTGLAGATRVRFGNAAATITADSSTQITVTSPPGTGTVPVTVTTRPGPRRSSTSTTTPTPRGRNHPVDLLCRPGLGSGGSSPLSATGGGSGNPVVFSVDAASGPGVCHVSGSTVTYAAAGSCVIDANQAGNAKYTAAPQVQRTITVNGLPSIAFTAPGSGKVGGSGVLSATGGGSGIPVVFSSRRLGCLSRVRSHGDVHRGGQLRRRR